MWCIYIMNEGFWDGVAHTRDAIEASRLIDKYHEEGHLVQVKFFEGL